MSAMPTTKLDFQVAQRIEKRRLVPSPLMPFLSISRIRSFSGGSYAFVLMYQRKWMIQSDC
ncbi:hypothetical protein SAMN05216281_1082 [Cryobacterium luteum]|nr:hypothetical protein SAMN05216281_1082 [Cryobacterium luteum]